MKYKVLRKKIQKKKVVEECFIITKSIIHYNRSEYDYEVTNFP